MQNLGEDEAFWGRGAAVFIMSAENSRIEVMRPAAFVYPAPGGFAWVEPSYADPYGAGSPALHVRYGTIEPRHRGFVCRGGGKLIAVEPYIDDDDLPLEWFARYLKENGLQWIDERERVRKLISPSIESHANEAGRA